MKQKLLEILGCPICSGLLTYAGSYAQGRLHDGLLTCSGCEVQYQVLDQMGILIDQGLSSDEFQWEVDVSELRDFDALRAAYNAALADEVRSARSQLLQHLVDQVGNRPGHVLDIATGMGALFRRVAARLATERCNAGHLECLATDVDTSVLRGTLRKTAAEGHGAIASFVAMDACHLGLQDEVIDTVISLEGFANVPDGAGAIDQAARVLRPGGQLSFSTLLLKEDSPSIRLAAEHGHYGLMTEGRVEQALAQAGLQVSERVDFVSGKWAGCPYDLLPLEGDWFAHAVYTAGKPS